MAITSRAESESLIISIKYKHWQCKISVLKICSSRGNFPPSSTGEEYGRVVKSPTFHSNGPGLQPAVARTVANFNKDIWNKAEKICFSLIRPFQNFIPNCKVKSKPRNVFDYKSDKLSVVCTVFAIILLLFIIISENWTYSAQSISLIYYNSTAITF